VIGAVYRPQIKVNARDEFIARNFYIESSSYERFVDTIALSDTKGTITIPSGYGLGVSLSRTDRWFVGADYRFDNWSDYKSFGKTDSLVNSQSFSLGARLVPDYTSTSYLNRIDYRIGGQYFQSYLKLREKRINGYSVTFGIGLPMRSIALKGTRSMLNIGFEIGQIGSIEQNLIRENYINFSLGLTIYEVWFFKRRYK
jgi:hypothetical protein